MITEVKLLSSHIQKCWKCASFDSLPVVYRYITSMVTAHHKILFPADLSATEHLLAVKKVKKYANSSGFPLHTLKFLKPSLQLLFFAFFQHLMYSTFDVWGEFIFRNGLFSYWYLGNSSFWRYDLIWVSSMRLRHEPATWHFTSSLSGKNLQRVTFVWFIRSRYCSTQACLSRDEYRTDLLPAQWFHGCQIQG